VEENNMYAAWEKGHCAQLENYRHTEGEPPSDASSTLWMNVAPPILIVQMNRTKFDPTTGNEKKQHMVPIEPVLNCHRFMYKNRLLVEQTRKTAEDMRDYLKKKEQELLNYDNYTSKTT
jgi:hypothetical protein